MEDPFVLAIGEAGDPPSPFHLHRDARYCGVVELAMRLAATLCAQHHAVAGGHPALVG
ncbi:MAG: hypothetical protein HN849_20025 [Victivallales bacterium]|nr:hypothetical protein [Victivallales bacterium]MBT7165839.1 hypothetical protein [Victivallales bacterium]MBT7301823.1 hypothetical protein [Victivallales bacterium]